MGVPCWNTTRGRSYRDVVFYIETRRYLKWRRFTYRHSGDGCSILKHTNGSGCTLLKQWERSGVHWNIHHCYGLTTLRNSWARRTQRLSRCSISSENGAVFPNGAWFLGHFLAASDCLSRCKKQSVVALERSVFYARKLHYCRKIHWTCTRKLHSCRNKYWTCTRKLHYCCNKWILCAGKLYSCREKATHLLYLVTILGYCTIADLCAYVANERAEGFQLSQKPSARIHLEHRGWQQTLTLATWVSIYWVSGNIPSQHILGVRKYP
jgi:hypothetical protein